MKKQPRGGVASAQPGDEPAAAVHADPRFAAVHSNPRFARFPKARVEAARKHRCAVHLTPPVLTQAKSRVEIDQRFADVFNDPKFKRQTVVDKRGRATGAKCVATATTAAALQVLTPCAPVQGAHR